MRCLRCNGGRRRPQHEASGSRKGAVREAMQREVVPPIQHRRPGGKVHRGKVWIFDYISHARIRRRSGPRSERLPLSRSTLPPRCRLRKEAQIGRCKVLPSALPSAGTVVSRSSSLRLARRAGQSSQSPAPPRVHAGPNLVLAPVGPNSFSGPGKGEGEGPRP